MNKSNYDKIWINPCNIILDTLNFKGKEFLEKDCKKTNNDKKYKNKIENFLLPFNSKKSTISIAFSHDNYLTTNGGIQKCIKIEEQSCKDDAYIHIFPIINKLWILDTSYANRVLWGININGKNIGQIWSNELIDLFKDFKNILLRIIIHSPLGHCLDDILNLASANQNEAEWYCWVHDFTTICPSFQLLRNNVEYCGAPEVASLQCNMCYAGVDRKKNSRLFTRFFNAINSVMIFPSEVAKNIWVENTSYNYKELAVIEHYQLGKKIKVQKEKNAEIKIAFAGTVAYHKGWNDFLKLIEAFNEIDSDYSFSVFSGGAPLSNLYDHKVVTIGDNEKLNMSNQLKENNIDIAFIGSIWPETFCLTAFEAIAADSFIVANYLSGNAANLVHRYKNGYVYRGVEDLISLLRSTEFKQSIFLRKANKQYTEIIASKMTFSIIH